MDSTPTSATIIPFSNSTTEVAHRRSRARANQTFDADVLVIGSGFGGSVAALRFAEAGQRVVVLERGDWVRRDAASVGPCLFWRPERGLFGINDMRMRGKKVLPWVGACVGGGSHVYAGTLKRSTDLSAYPASLRSDDLTPYYERAERMMEARLHPRVAPYSPNRLTSLMLDAGAALARQEPGLVQDHGQVPLAMQFAGEGQEPGQWIRNAHGSAQRTVHPLDSSMMGGDVDVKNSLDHNYLFQARQLGAQIQALTEVDRIEPLPLAGYRVHFVRRDPESGTQTTGSISARRVVLAAGAIGTTEILLRNRDIHRTLTRLSPTLGSRYTTNGNFMSFIVPFRGMAVGWLGFGLLVAGLVTGSLATALVGGTAYALQLALSRRAFEPDLGTTNGDFIKLRGRHGGKGSVYVESGRYTTPFRLLGCFLLSALGQYRPSRYRGIVAVCRILEWIPPLALLARSWPVPLLQMGPDDAVGSMALDDQGRVTLDYDVEANRAFYAYLDAIGKKVARACRAIWIPNLYHRLTGRIEVPHNQGGAPMGDTPAQGVVDHAGRVFGYRDLMVLDGSIIPRSPGPNPALTILALAERAMDVVVAQMQGREPTTGDRSSTPTRRLVG